MKKTLLTLALAAGCTTGALHAQPAKPHDELIFPDPSRTILLVAADTAVSDNGPKARILPLADSLATLIYAELNDPYYRSMIRLNQCSRNLAGNSGGPNVLLLSNREGGFARQGLVLIEDGKEKAYPQLNYVDLVVDRKRLGGGELDIFAHELGHVMMNNVWTQLGAGADDYLSPKMHASVGITDYYTAIYEGFGEHFQRLTQEHIPLYRELMEDRFRRSDNTVLAWHSSIDEEARVNGVLNNRYLYRKLLPAGIGADSLTASDRILLHHASPLFDPTRLRNAQELLASEGWVATLFYRMAHDAALGANYAPPAFYRPFLLRDLPAGVAPADLFTPWENVLLKHFWVWRQLNTRNLAGTAVLIEYINAWTRDFPADREALLRLFAGTSAGRTADPALTPAFLDMNRAGITGDYKSYTRYREQYKTALEALVQRLLKGELEPGAAVGPEIWVQHPGLRIRRALWAPRPDNPLRVNINAATPEEIEAFLGKEQAQGFLVERDRRGFFRSLEEARKAGFGF